MDFRFLGVRNAQERAPAGPGGKGGADGPYVALWVGKQRPHGAVVAQEQATEA